MIAKLKQRLMNCKPKTQQEEEVLESLQTRVAQLESALTLALQRLVQLDTQNHKKSTPSTTPKKMVVKRFTNKSKSFTDRLNLLPPKEGPTYH